MNSNVIKKTQRAINQLLSRFGIKIVRATYYKRRKNNLDSGGGYIEFVGPSGIGKSTLFKNFSRMTNLPYLYRQNFDAKDYADKFDSVLQWHLLAQKFSDLNSRELEEHKKLKLIHYFVKVAMDDAVVNSILSDNLLMFDEGLFHNFSKQINELPDDQFKELTRDRAFIFLEARDPKTVVQRRRKRFKETGVIVTHHVGLDDLEMEKEVANSQVKFATLKRRLTAVDVTHCTVFAEDSIEYNCSILAAFEKQLLAEMALGATKHG